MIASAPWQQRLAAVLPAGLTGSVVSTSGLTVTVGGFPAPVGAEVEIQRDGRSPVRGEVVGFRDRMTVVFPLAETLGVRRGNRVRLLRSQRSLAVGPALLGRVIDADGQPLDNAPPPTGTIRRPIHGQATNATARPRVTQPLATGVRTIDGLLTCGIGQRVGVFATSGVGKSVCLSMIARNSSADVNVIGLIGERGREVNDFLHNALGPAAVPRTVVVVATSDQPALVRVQAALTATTIAEYFRDTGKDVLLLVDSLSRVATAQREVGLAAGEPPASHGFPPSVFTLLPQILERAGNRQRGSMSAFYSVLSDHEDGDDPVSEAARSFLDGQIVLSQQLANAGHFPAINVLRSNSRLMPQLVEPRHHDAAIHIRQALATLREHEDLLAMGAYQENQNPALDRVMRCRDELQQWLTQGPTETNRHPEDRQAMLALANKLQ